MSNVIRKTVGVIALSVFSFFIGCGDNELIEPLSFQLNTGLIRDNNGYYHMSIDTNSLQSFHRISGKITRNGESVNTIKFAWASNMYWIMGDNFGYVIANNGLTDDLVYVGYDTTHITWFSGWEVPIVNGSSYSREDGEVNTMLAPVRSMRGDTATIYFSYYDNWLYQTSEGNFKIIFN